MKKELIAEKIESYKNGNMDSFADIYELSSQELYVYARYLENNNKVEYSAEDLLQDTYVQIMNSLPGLQEPEAFPRWSKTIMENLLKQKARKTNREVYLMGHDDDEEGLDFFEQQPETDEEWLPGEELDKREVGQIVMDALHQLPLEQKKVAYLYYMQEMSIKDIAAELEISEGTVKSRMFKARENMRASLESYEKKHDIRLHSILAFPFLSSLLKEYSAETVVPGGLKNAIMEKAAGDAVTASVASNATAGSSAGTGAAVGATAVKAGGGGFLKTVAGKILVGALAGAIAVGGGMAAMNAISGGGMNPEDTVTLPFKAEEEAEATVEELNIKNFELGENIAGQMIVGDSWFAFTPETEDYYSFYVEMEDYFDAEYLDIHVFENRIDEKGYIFGGVLSDGKEDGSYQFYTTMDGKLKAGKTYYFCYNWRKDFHLTDIHLEAGDGETFSGFQF